MEIPLDQTYVMQQLSCKAALHQDMLVWKSQDCQTASNPQRSLLGVTPLSLPPQHVGRRGCTMPLLDLLLFAALQPWWLKTLGPVESAWLVCYTMTEIPTRLKLPFLKQCFSTRGPRSACVTISLLETQIAMRVCLFTCHCLSPLLACKPWRVKAGLFTLVSHTPNSVWHIMKPQ